MNVHDSERLTGMLEAAGYVPADPSRVVDEGADVVAAVRAMAATVAEHRRLWQAAHGAAPSRATLGRALLRVGWTRKKSR